MGLKFITAATYIQYYGLCVRCDGVQKYSIMVCVFAVMEYRNTVLWSVCSL
jgi:hypothetical protein